MIALCVYGALGLWIWWCIANGQSNERDHARGVRHSRGCQECDWRNTHGGDYPQL